MALEVLSEILENNGAIYLYILLQYSSETTGWLKNDWIFFNI